MGIFTQDECSSCKVTGKDLKMDASVLKITPEEIKEERDSWIGPTDEVCSRCNSKKIFFMINPPPSPDEPPIITHKCFNCFRKKTTYKH